MLVAQITDLHLGFEPGVPDELNRRRLDAALDALTALDPAPAALIASGDLAETGDPADYRTLRAIFDALPFPVLPAIGNHDDRAAFASAFGDRWLHRGYVQHVADLGPLRIVTCDTKADGRHRAGFDEARADWLDAALGADARPTIVVVHHPPIDTGNAWMTEDAAGAWVARLAGVVRHHPQVVRMVAGHVHRGMVAEFAGTVLAVCPATAPQLAPDFAPLDPERPDGRDLVTAEPPGFALHWWTGRTLVTQFGVAGPHPVLARFDAEMQPTIRGILDEPAAS